VIILLLSVGLLVSLIGGVWYIYYFRHGIVLFSTPTACIACTTVISALYVSVYILMAWASIERHILIFHPNWFRTQRKCFFFHYLPLVVCILYPPIFYFVILVIIPCDIPFNYSMKLCNRYLCVTRISWIGAWDGIGHYILPAFITLIFSVALFVRVLYSRFRIQRRVEWRNYKKLTLQLLPISVLYIAIQLPPMILYAAYTVGLSRSVGANYLADGQFFTCWVVFFTPFATIISLPDLRTKCKRVIFFWRSVHAVGPQTLSVTHRTVGQTRTAVAPIG
jgi:hypothetical protein